MHHFVYETTNLINGKKYIGKHSTNDINDKYLGSGTLLLQAIKKYSKENFERKILIIIGNEEEAYWYENKLVTKEIIESNNYYNSMSGGYGFDSRTAKKIWKSPDHRKKQHERLKELWKNSNFKELHSKRMKKQMKELWKDLDFKELNKKYTKKQMNEQWKDPIFREKISKKTKKQWENPKFKQMMSERVQGENAPHSKLIEENVIDIKKRLQKGERGVDIAKIYNVTKTTISSIKCGKTWKYLNNG